jgi:hypothetical protein
MHNSIRSADAMTHIKVVVVSFVAAIAMVTIGISARNFGVNAETSLATKAGKPMNFSTKDIPTVR